MRGKDLAPTLIDDCCLVAPLISHQLKSGRCAGYSRNLCTSPVTPPLVYSYSILSKSSTISMAATALSLL